eukprot:3650728-Amphidinium_carterae.1
MASLQPHKTTQRLQSNRSNRKAQSCQLNTCDVSSYATQGSKTKDTQEVVQASLFRSTLNKSDGSRLELQAALSEFANKLQLINN